MPYVHYVPPAKTNKNWPNAFNFVLVENMNHLREIFKNFEEGKTCIAFDLETTGLNPEEDFIVGACLCMDGKTGYYVPINHYIDKYNVYDEGLDLIYEYLTKAKKVFLYNARYDLRMMRYHGFDKNNEEHKKKIINGYIKYDVSKIDFYDVSIGVWLADTNVKMPSLKFASKHFLGITQQTFQEVSEGVENFYYIDPEKCAFYGASDAICTYLLVPATIKYYKEAGFAGKLDNKVLYPLMCYEEQKIALDGDLLKPYEKEIRDRLEYLEKSIYKRVGYVFNLNSPPQVAEAFERLGIDTGHRTKTGYMQTGITLLSRLPDEVKKKYPIIGEFIEYKELYKVYSSYIKVFKKEYEERGYARCAYKTQQVPTGRLASGKDKKNNYFSKFNIHSIPKPKPAMYYVIDLKDRNLFDKKEHILMGYQLKPVEYEGDNIKDGRLIYGNSCIGVVEGYDPKLNARRVFIANTLDDKNPDEWIWCGIDYAAQELRIPANLSREPVWMNAFVSGGDVHKETAIKLFGEENYNKQMRKRAKGANFGILYGMTAVSLAESFGMTLAEGEEFYMKYKQALPTLFAWEERIINKARRKGTAYTYFGRPRRVRFYFQNNQVGFGKRTVVNTTVQGTASDILKITLIKLWKNLLNHPDYKNDVRFLTTVHDEIDLAIRRTRLKEILKLAEDTIRFELPEWPVVIDVESSIGFSWGDEFPVIWREDIQEWYPKLEIEYN